MKPEPSNHTIYFHLLPYMEIFNKKGHDTKATAPFMAKRGVTSHFALPTFRVEIPEARKLTLDYYQAVGIVLLQSEWGPIIKHPT